MCSRDLKLKMPLELFALNLLISSGQFVDVPVKITVMVSIQEIIVTFRKQTFVTEEGLRDGLLGIHQ